MKSSEKWEIFNPSDYKADGKVKVNNFPFNSSALFTSKNEAQNNYENKVYSHENGQKELKVDSDIKPLQTNQNCYNKKKLQDCEKKSFFNMTERQFDEKGKYKFGNNQESSQKKKKYNKGSYKHFKYTESNYYGLNSHSMKSNIDYDKHNSQDKNKTFENNQSEEFNFPLLNDSYIKISMDNSDKNDIKKGEKQVNNLEFKPKIADLYETDNYSNVSFYSHVKECQLRQKDWYNKNYAYINQNMFFNPYLQNSLFESQSLFFNYSQTNPLLFKYFNESVHFSQFPPNFFNSQASQQGYNCTPLPTYSNTQEKNEADESKKKFSPKEEKKDNEFKEKMVNSAASKSCFLPVEERYSSSFNSTIEEKKEVLLVVNFKMNENIHKEFSVLKDSDLYQDLKLFFVQNALDCNLILSIYIKIKLSVAILSDVRESKKEQSYLNQAFSLLENGNENENSVSEEV